MARTVPPGSCASPPPTRPSKRAATAALPPAAASAASSAERSRSPTQIEPSLRDRAGDGLPVHGAVGRGLGRRGAVAPQHPPRQIGQQQLTPGALVDQRLEDHVAQLVDVARPRVRAQRRQRGGRRALHLVPRGRLGLLPVEALREVRDQRGQIGDALAQRRHPDRDDREALVQIGTEEAGRAQRAQIAVGGGEDAEVDDVRRV